MIEAGATHAGSRFFGYKADLRRFQRNAMLLLSPGSILASSASLAAFRGPITNQGRSGSCTGHGTSQGIYTAFGAAGLQLPFVPSQRLLYALPRALERPSYTIPLTDSGAMPSDLITVVGRYGVRPMFVNQSPDGRFSDVWGPDDGLATPVVNDEPDFDDLEESGVTLLTGEFRIDETSPTAYQQVAACIDQKKSPVGTGLFVDSAFMSWSAGQPPIDSIDLNDPQGGGHWVSIDGYTTELVGGATQLVFDICNSWGKEAGDAGIYRITQRALAMSVSDLIVWNVRQANV